MIALITILISFGFGLMGMLISTHSRAKRMKQIGVETEAEVLKITDTTVDSGLSSGNTIVVGYQGGGKHQEVSINAGKKYKQGDKLKIIYQKDESEKFVIVNTGIIFVAVNIFWVLLSLAAIAGGILLLLGVIFAK